MAAFSVPSTFSPAPFPAPAPAPTPTPAVVEDDRSSLNSSDEEYGDDDSKFVEDALYGSEMDDEDEQWIEEHVHHKNHNELVDGKYTLAELKNAKRIRMKVKVASSSASSAPPTIKEIEVVVPPREKEKLKSATLQCPLCFTTICMDCQPHEKYQNQFRAMFVMNIVVDWNDTVNDLVEGVEGVVTKYYKTQCCSCGTVVAGLDYDEEIYYFFGILASH